MDERGNNLLAKLFESLFQFRLLLQLQGIEPDVTPPASGQRRIFQVIDHPLLLVHEAGLEGAEPVCVLPIGHQQAQRVTSQLRQRVMRDRFSAIDEKGDVVTPEDTAKDALVIWQRPDEHRRIAEAPAALAHVFQDLSRDRHGFGFGVGTGIDVETGGKFRVACCVLRVGCGGFREW